MVQNKFSFIFKEKKRNIHINGFTCEIGSCYTLITGTGRAGTSALMAILTELGLPTGFSLKEVRKIDDTSFRAGLEICGGKDSLKCIRKGNFSSIEIYKSITVASQPVQLSKSTDVFGRIIVLVRDTVLNSALSRAAQNNKGNIEGGFWKGASSFADMLSVNYVLLAELVSSLEDSDMPHIYISYPKFANDKKYAYKKLFGASGALHFYNISFHSFIAAHKQVIKLNSGLS